MQSGEQPNPELPESGDPIDGYRWCPCGTTYVMAVGSEPRRTAVCVGCHQRTGRVGTSLEVRQFAARQEETGRP